MSSVALTLDPAYNDEASMPGPLEDVVTDDQIREGNWPRQLVLKEEVKNRLIQFLDFEIDQCLLERDMLVQDWMQWQSDYWAKPESKEKNFPFKRAANVVIPMTAIAVEAVYARLINTLFSVKPFWSLKPLNEDWAKVAPVLEQWFDTEANGPLDVYGFCRESLLELIKLGTGIGKSGFEKDVRKSITTINGKELEKIVTVRQGATLHYVPLANFLIRLHDTNPQTCTWVGEEHTATWTQMKRYVISGMHKKQSLNDIKAWAVNRNNVPSANGEYVQKLDKLQNTEPSWHEVFKFHEIWLSFDVDGDGSDEEIVVDFHKDSRTILSARYNWYDDLHRPYRVGVYIPVEGRVYGIGVGKQNEQFQKVITTIHRQRLDSQTLANMFQLAIKKGSDYGPGEPLFPGKMWFLEDPKNDIVPLQLSDPTISQFNHEDYARSYSERYTGVNEVVLGMPQEGTPGTATSDMARLAEGNKKFDLVLKNCRKWLGELGTDALANYQQFGDNNRFWAKMGPERGQIIQQVLSMPPQLVRDGAIVEVTVTDSLSNKEIQQQQIMGLAASLGQFYDRQKQSAMALGSPELLLIMTQACLVAEDELITNLVRSFRTSLPGLDLDKLLLTPKIVEMLSAQYQQLSGGLATGLAPADEASRMAQILIGAGDGSGQSRERGATRERPDPNAKNSKSN